MQVISILLTLATVPASFASPVNIASRNGPDQWCLNNEEPKCCDAVTTLQDLSTSPGHLLSLTSTLRVKVAGIVGFSPSVGIQCVGSSEFAESLCEKVTNADYSCEQCLAAVRGRLVVPGKPLSSVLTISPLNLILIVVKFSGRGA